MAEASVASFCRRKLVDSFPFYLGNLCENHLADTVGVLYGERPVGEVYKYNTYLAPIVGVDSARSV